MCDEINFMPEEPIKKEVKPINFDELVNGFPPERFAEIDEELLWEI